MKAIDFIITLKLILFERLGSRGGEGTHLIALKREKNVVLVLTSATIYEKYQSLRRMTNIIKDK